MARNGNGTFVLPPSNPVAPGTVIESEWANDTMSDIAAALTQSLAYDGQTLPIANLPMGGFHHTNVSDPSSRNQYATLGMVQDGRQNRVQITGGVNDLVGTLVGGATAYTAGAIINFFAPAANTGAMTLNYNGIGARSLRDQNGLALSPGEIAAGEFVLATYTGTEFRLLTSVDAAVAADLYNLSISGQVRPPSDVYPALTIATGTTVNVPAGTAWIVPPGNDTDNAIQVSWLGQTITMQFLTSSFTTFVMVDETGVIQQIPGRAVGANFRHMAVLGVVEHINGVVNNVITRPSIFGDDGYRSRDQASLLANTVINGALVTPNSVSGLQLDVAQGTIFIPGGTANTVDSPNTFNVPPQANIQFRTLAGQALVSALTSTVPVGSYDANGAGIIAALPNPGDATIHRLFYLYGQYVLVYGQQVYSSIENAMSMIAWDRTKFKKSLYLADATLLAEVAAIRTATNLNIITQGAVVCPGGLNFSIGSPGGIAEAPIDGFPYGRRNAAWFQVLGATSPVINTDATITGTQPVLKEIVTPANSAGTSGLAIYNDVNKWFGMETVLPDDKAYFRSYNPATGALRFTTTYDLATGDWTYAGALNEAPFASIASAATIDLGATHSNTVNVTGTTTITSLGVVAQGRVRRMVFSGPLTLVHNATSLIIPGGANILTSTGDTVTALSLGSGNWRIIDYTPINVTLGTLQQQITTNLARIGDEGCVEFRNQIINGSFRIAQRAVPNVNGQYPCDRWQFFFSAGTTGCSATVNQWSQSDIEALKTEGSVLGVAGTIGGLNEFILVQQQIENNRRFGGRRITVSFLAYKVGGGTLGVRLQGRFGTGGSPSANQNFGNKTFTLTAFPTRFSLTVDVPSWVGKTFGTNNDSTLCLVFDKEMGTTIAQSVGYAAGWSDTGSLQIAEVQVEWGNYITPFEQRNAATELMLCQRFYETLLVQYMGAATVAGVLLAVPCYWKVYKRRAPTVTTIVAPTYVGMSGATVDGIDVNAARAWATATAANTVQFTIGIGIDAEFA